ARAERDSAVRHDDNFLAVRGPGGLDVIVEDAEIKASVPKAVRFGQTHGFSGASVLQGHVVDVELVAGTVAHEGQTLSIGRPGRIEIEFLASGELRTFARRQIQKHQVYAALTLR